MKNRTGALIQMLMVVCAGVACAATVPVPTVKAIPLTADSYPFLSNARTLAPADLAKAGYVEEEYIVSGTANVYDSAPDGTIRREDAECAVRRQDFSASPVEGPEIQRHRGGRDPVAHAPV